jgi:hypothetical protein
VHKRVPQGALRIQLEQEPPPHTPGLGHLGHEDRRSGVWRPCAEARIAEIAAGGRLLLLAHGLLLAQGGGEPVGQTG